MLRGVGDESVVEAAQRELRVLANRRHLAEVLGDASLLEPWRGPVVEPGPRELVAVPLEVWAAEPVAASLEVWAGRDPRSRRARWAEEEHRERVALRAGWVPDVPGPRCPGGDRGPAE